MSKVLFLDIDGVCNSERFLRVEYERNERPTSMAIDPKAAELVREILSITSANLVISSTWRNSERGLQIIRDEVHPEIYGITPRSPRGFRGDEVGEWLEEHPEVEKYAILDDDGDFYKYQQPLFRTSRKDGLTPGMAAQVIRHLGKAEPSELVPWKQSERDEEFLRLREIAVGKIARRFSIPSIDTVVEADAD